MSGPRRRGADLLLVLRLFVRIDGARLALGALLATVVVLAGMALLGTSGWFITATGLAGLAAAGAAGLNVLLPSAAIRLLALVRTFGRYGERLLTHDATLNVVAALRERLFRAWATPAAARALLRRPARVLFRLTHDIDALEAIYLRLAVPACAAAGAALLAGAVLGALDLRLGLALGAWLLLCGLGITAALAARARVAALRRARAIERLREAAIDLVAGQTDLLMAGRLQAQCATVAARDATLARADHDLFRLDSGAGWLYAVAGHAGVAAVLLACGALVKAQVLGAPAAALAILLALTALEPFAALRRGAIEAGRSWLAARRLAPRLREVPAAPSVPMPASAQLALRLQGASVFHAGRACPALSDIDLVIEDGERVALVGASGAGKSTLLGVIAGEWALQAGHIEARPACWLTQRVALFQDSLRDNLRLGCPDADDGQLWQALAAAGLEHDVRQFAGGLDTVLGEGGLGLSGGQARRLALARLLLRDAHFWLLDEPTEALDGATAADVLARLDRLALGRTVLLACHTRREAALASRLLLMEGGCIVADLRRGSPEFDAALAALRPD
ncbi:ATP-binding cassette domain-containing protein [Massilia sp. DWR3-1-1]|uniref:ATP-binding cassette domain-containing protein n=1 Tax=Massilia sp. DWR3-1-1 TaxID=2804559 RepID=UPI003CE963E9